MLFQAVFIQIPNEINTIRSSFGKTEFTFGFDGSDAKMDSFYRISANFKASDPLPRTITVIISSGADFDRPNASWRDHPETTAALTEWVNRILPVETADKQT